MVKHRGFKLCEAKRRDTENRWANVPDVTSYIYTQSRTFGFFTASSLILIAVAANPILLNCLT